MTETAQQKREREHREDLQRLRGFRPIDDDFMRGMFQQNLPLAQLVLRIVTGKPDLVLTRCETQADMKRVTGARSICLDAYGTDDSGKCYDLEIQRSDLGADPHRARYHSSVIDVENLDAGQEFKELPDTYIIFITESDFYGEGQAVYRIQRMNLTTGKPFDDGTYILYVNGEYRGDDELGKLMYDFNCTDADNMNYELMAERTRYLKKDPEGVRMMCKAMEDMRDKARAEGRAEGREEGRVEGREEGRAEGRVEGRAEGMNIFALLVKKLSELGRTEDIERAAADVTYRNQLLVELLI